MRIISWNANGKFREKFPFILNEDADIYVIQECENPEISNSDEYIEFASNYYWVGENQYYGLGIFAKNNVKLEFMCGDYHYLIDYLIDFATKNHSIKIYAYTSHDPKILIF